MGDDHGIPIPIRSNFPAFDGMAFKLLGKNFGLTGQTIAAINLMVTTYLFTKLCRKFIHVPFHWGGRNPLSVDSALFV